VFIHNAIYIYEHNFISLIQFLNIYKLKAFKIFFSQIVFSKFNNVNLNNLLVGKKFARMLLRRKIQPADIYTRVKISDTIQKPKKKNKRKLKISVSLKFFSTHLEYLIVEKLLSTGDGFITGKLIISPEIKKFLIEKYSIKKQWVKCENILAELNIITALRKHSNTAPVKVDDFQIKFGYNRRKKFVSAEGE
jgi:hypothetical protein